MRVLVTGASGFLGRNLLLQAPRHWDIAALYNTALDFPAFVTGAGLTNVRAMRCDLTDAGEVRAMRTAAHTSGPVDAALYLAANGDPAASARDPMRDLRQNAGALLTFLEHCPAPRLVFVSSGAVYDGLHGVVTPESRLDPRLPYAISKLACERYVQFFAERRGAPSSYVNVRFFGAYGPHEPVRKITTRFLAAIQRGDREFIVRGDGRNLIDFMYVDDAVRGLLRLIGDDRPVRATVDFASGKPASVNDIVAAMQRLTGSGIEVRRDGITEEYIEFRSGDRRMAEEFGCVPQTTFDDGFERLRAFVSMHGSAAVRG